MKKVVRMLGLCALVALAFTACKKDDTKSVTFSASMPKTVSDARTHAQGMDLVWDDGDAIKVFNGAGVNYDFTLTDKVDKDATFFVDDVDKVSFLSELQTADYTAFYPGAVVDGSNVRLTIPATQTYVQQHNFENGLYPMVGFNNADNFEFQSNAGFLNVSFYAPSGETRQVDKLVLIANEDIAGDLVYAQDGLSYVFEGTSNVITLLCESKQTIPSDGLQRDFTFVLPEGTLADGFTVELYDGETFMGSFTTQNPVNVIDAQTFTNMYAIQLP